VDDGQFLDEFNKARFGNQGFGHALSLRSEDSHLERKFGQNPC
jgi:hypothetical protein